MKSMTGYGYASHSEGNYQLEVELKSYNNRYLEFGCYINSILSCFESEVISRIKEVASRGKVEVSIRLKLFDANESVHLDEGLLKQYLGIFEDIKARYDLDCRPNASALLCIEDLFTTSSERNSEEYRPALEDCLEKALADFASSKIREGEATKADLIRLGQSFERANREIGELVASYEDYFKNLLLSKYEELNLSKGIDENRYLQEVGNLLVKYSINEEQKRLETHIRQYFKLLEEEGPVGKKLDFLCQEMNREVNTTASKSQNVNINLLTVQMKDDLENIREQVRNIE